VLALGCPRLHRNAVDCELEPAPQSANGVGLGDVLLEVLISELGERERCGGGCLAALTLALDVLEPPTGLAPGCEARLPTASPVLVAELDAVASFVL
jgi:hypothetical protein